MREAHDRFFVFAVLAALVLTLIAFIESQIFLRIYGAGNIPTIPFLVTIVITSVIYRKCLSKTFDQLDERIRKNSNRD